MTFVFIICSALYLVTPIFAGVPPGAEKIGLPFEGVTDATRPISLIIRELIFYAGILAILVLSYGGILLLTSYGDESKVKKAKGLVTYALLGVVLSISAYAIISLINELRI